MPEYVASTIVVSVMAYLGVGLVFAVPFLARGAGAVDEDARAGSLGFRVMILPGVAALWPLLLRRWTGGRRVRLTPHERAAEGGR